ncbi:hypothetical protein [Scytonema sp. PCC 10023]|uniref:hypothetical protein n=1 Tax=Scytonema sp. PCC 10023 TaxID=1680591 RepID=UPI0039C6D96B
MANHKFFQLNLAISHSQGIQKLFATAILLFAIVYPSSFAQAADSNKNDFNNTFGMRSLQPGVNPLGDQPQPFVVARRYDRRSRVRRIIIGGPVRRNQVRRVRVRPVGRNRVQRVYQPVRRNRVQRVYAPVRRYNRYRGQRVYVR